MTLDLGVPVDRLRIPQGILTLRGRWSDAIQADPNRPSTEQENFARPAFWTMSAELGTTFGGTRATLAVRNLLNHHYREPLSFIDEPGRTFAFGLRRDFELFSLDRRSVR
jgi:hypothetical protein